MTHGRGMWRRIAATAGAIAVGAALTVPAHAAGEDEEVEDDLDEQGEYDEFAGDDVLTIATGQSIENWNPFIQIYVIEHQFRQLQYEPLVRMSAEDYSPSEGLAEDWEESEDGLTWTFHLREATWHDGEEFTADDVVYTYHIIENDPVISARNADVVELIENVEAIDDRTVEFTLSSPSVNLEGSDQVIVPEHIWSEYEGEWNEYGNDDFPIVGIGPYQMVDFSTDAYIRYEAFDDYWQGAPGFSELVYQYYTEPDTAVAALEAGEVDLVGGLNEAQLGRVEGLDHVTTNVAPDRRWLAFRFNTGAVTRDGEEFGSGHPALADPQVRRALHHAVDKQELIERVRGGYGEVAHSIVPNVFSTIHWEPSDDERMDFDLEEAGRLLDEAGYEMGDDGVRVGPDGEPLSLVFGVDAGNAEREGTAQFIAEWFNEIGVETEQRISEDVQDEFDEGNIDLAFTGWGINPNPTYNLNRQSCGQLPAAPGDGTTDTFYCNEEFDSLVRDQESETDPDARAELLFEAQRILYEDSPIIFLWYPTVMEAYNSTAVGDFTTQPADEGMIMGQIGSWAYHSASPTGESVGGASTAVLIGVGVVVLLGVAVLVVVLVRRRQTAEERE
ncbi:ABC transporter substrate-binding protein [Pseudactinotalea sp. Z1748]|uniref:ABC transporter substrate-binding protein n=1 Tax=Pseudactinotalea sp. Z1748 TaxID=3413027 RepID=UPI003C7EB744